MSHIQRQSLLYGSQSALIAGASTGPEMPLILRVARHVFIYALGCNLPFQYGLQMTSSIQCTSNQGPWQAKEVFWSHCIESCIPQRVALCRVCCPTNELGITLVTHDIQVTGHDFSMVLCGIQLLIINLQQLRPAILKMSSQKFCHPSHRHHVAPVLTH